MSLSLRANLQVDDDDPHFAYSAGDWSTLEGSTRQYNGSVHLTRNVGATVSFAFQAQAFIIYATIPGADFGNVTVNVTIDGGTPIAVTQLTNSSDVYMDPLFTSSIMEFTNHSVVVTNRGNISFRFDELLLFSNDIVPYMIDPPSISTTTTTNTTTTNSPSSSAQPTSGSSRSSDHKGAIIGGVVGGLAFIALVLVAFLLRRRIRNRNRQSEDNQNPSKPFAPKPFPLNISPTTQNYPYPTDSHRPFPSVEKAALRAQSANEDQLGHSSTVSSPDQSSSSAYRSGVNPASALDLNLSSPSNTTNEVGLETFGPSETATTYSSMYASLPMPGPGADASPPPYQPLSVARTLGGQHQIDSHIQEETESRTFG